MTTALRRTTALRQRMLQDLQLAGLSERTQEAYLRAVRQLADHFHIPPDRLTEPQVRDYFLHLKNDRKFASGSLMIASSAIKFFYSHTAPRDWPTLQRLRVRTEKKLPDVLSVEEVRRLIAAVRTRHDLSTALPCVRRSDVRPGIRTGAGTGGLRHELTRWPR
jgi:integrase/recombinase XerD